MERFHILQDHSEPVQYIPLQARPGDKAIYLQKHAILLLLRDELGLG